MQDGVKVEQLNAAIAGLGQALQIEIPPQERPAAFGCLSRGFRLRFLLRGASSDALQSAKAAKFAVEGQPNASPELWLNYAQRLTEAYEASGDRQGLETAQGILQNLIRKFGTNAFEPQVSSLAQTFLLRYRNSGNVNDLQEAFGLVVPIQYSKAKPPAMFLYVQGCVCREFYRRSGSLQRLD